MSDQQPPAGTPEYLDSTGGDRTAPSMGEGEAPAGRRSRRTTWLVGGGVVGLLVVGGGAWAAMSFFQQGSQPAEALPSTTIAYASVDLDPSGSQKIDAFKTLEKFPAFKRFEHRTHTHKARFVPLHHNDLQPIFQPSLRSRH